MAPVELWRTRISLFPSRSKSAVPTILSSLKPLDELLLELLDELLLDELLLDELLLILLDGESSIRPLPPLPDRSDPFPLSDEDPDEDPLDCLKLLCCRSLRGTTLKLSWDA
jgi:hypothetical protein